MPELSICQQTMLLAIYADEVLDTDQLLERVPYREPAIGVEDISDWFGELQGLLDLGLVAREPGPVGYVYRTAGDAVDIIYAHTPPSVLRRLG